MDRYAKHYQSSTKRALPVWLTVALVAAVALTIAAVIVACSHGDDETANGPGQPGSSTLEPGTSGADGVAVTTEEPIDESVADEALKEAEYMMRGYFYDEAIALLDSVPAGLKEEEIAALRSDIEGAKASLVKWESDQYYHVFFHSLIVDTDLAFDNKGHPAEGYNMWMTTKEEFIDMLPLLMEDGYILYDITGLVDFDESGKATKADIYLPPGKKPLVISIDDVNYYDYMKPDGFADRLDVDEEGNVVTIVKNADGTESATYDGDVMPILDSFVKEHPEFSWRGAKGVVALTGYAGAFGYRITDLPDYTPEEQEYMLNKVTEVAQALRATGWQIANHSYTHNSYWENTMTMDQLKYDTGRWINEIMPYVGETNIIITPFGARFKYDDERFKYIVNELGFNIFCPVGSGMTTVFHDDCMVMDRLNLDGYNMLLFPERISKHFFDPSLVVDERRPPLTID